MLSERERKLMRWSYEAGFTHGHHFGSEDIPSAGDGFDDWLNEVAAEGGITVEMVVDTDAGRVMLNKVSEAVHVIQQEMINDNPSKKGSLAHSWHDTIAMACFDAMEEAELNRNHESDSLDHNAIANDAASRFMQMCFDVDTSKGA